jgi:tRNA(adenine34) deaminase
LGEHDEHFMRQALDLARTARDSGEVPVGALVVQDGRIVGSGHNRSIADIDPTGHAEIVALRDASQQAKNYRLVGSTIYCTVEPCLMCLGAMMHARVARLVFGAAESRIGATDKLESMRSLGADFNHRVEIEGGILAGEASELILKFFREKRAEAKPGKKLTRSGEVPKWS